MTKKEKKNSKLRHNEYYDMQKTFDSLYSRSGNGENFKNLMQYITDENNIKLSKSCECEVCQMYSDKAVRKIKDYARKRGTKKTLLKVLNNKFFKDEDFQSNEENHYDDLPF